MRIKPLTTRDVVLQKCFLQLYLTSSYINKIYMI